MGEWADNKGKVDGRVSRQQSLSWWESEPATKFKLMGEWAGNKGKVDGRVSRQQG